MLRESTFFIVLFLCISIVFAGLDGDTESHGGGGGGGGTTTTSTPSDQVESAVETGQEATVNVGTSTTASIDPSTTGTPTTGTTTVGVANVGAVLGTAAAPAAAAANPSQNNVGTTDSESTGNGGSNTFIVQVPPAQTSPLTPTVPSTTAHIENGEISTGNLEVNSVIEFSSVTNAGFYTGPAITTSGTTVPVSSGGAYVTFSSAQTLLINSGTSVSLAHNLINSQIIVDANGNVIYAYLESAVDDNTLAIEGYEIVLNANDFIEMELLSNGYYNLTLSSNEGNVTDPFLHTECITLSPTSRYLYTGVSNENFAFYIPSTGLDYSLCLRTNPSQNFQRSCNSCGYIDLLNSNMSLSGIFDYELPSLLYPATINGFMAEKAIQSKDSLNIIVKETNKTVLPNDNPADVMKSVTSSANFML